MVEGKRYIVGAYSAIVTGDRGPTVASGVKLEVVDLYRGSYRLEALIYVGVESLVIGVPLIKVEQISALRVGVLAEELLGLRRYFNRDLRFVSTAILGLGSAISEAAVLEALCLDTEKIL